MMDWCDPADPDAWRSEVDHDPFAGLEINPLTAIARGEKRNVPAARSPGPERGQQSITPGPAFRLTRRVGGRVLQPAKFRKLKMATS